MKVPPGLMPGVLGVPPELVVVVMPGLVVVRGLVPGPPGPKPGEVGELDVEGEFEEGELEDEGWGEFISPPPPHPVLVIDAHMIHRQATGVDNHLAIAALG